MVTPICVPADALIFWQRKDKVMKIDLETELLPDACLADVCIVGGGVAGLVLANALRRRNLRVDVLEAGGDRLDTGCQQSFNVDCFGRRHTGVTEGRCRVFGGTSARWGGQLLPFGEELFSKRLGRQELEWPISPQEIYCHAHAVQAIMGVNDHPYGAEFPEHIGCLKHALQIEDMRVRYSKWAPFARRNLAQTIGKTLGADSGARIVLNAAVVALEMDREGRRVESARCRTSEGREVYFRARIFVLASGTVEAVRLLLCSQQGEQTGIGNAYGQVGQYFHDHLGVVVGEIQQESMRRWEQRFAPWWIGGVLHTARLEAHPSIVTHRQWLDVMACFTFVTEGTEFEWLRQLLKGRQRGYASLRQLFGLAWRLPSNVDLLRIALAAKLGKRRLVPRGARVEIQIFSEQMPGSSIRLSSERDALGMPRAVIDWRILPEELQTIHEFSELLRKRWLPAWGDAIWHYFSEPEAYLPHTRDTFHMMGGARMGSNERISVVDRELKVHGVGNLYVASCATYPSGGSSNPTFTLMCLCLRLAETLERLVQDVCRSYPVCAR